MVLCHIWSSSSDIQFFVFQNLNLIYHLVYDKYKRNDPGGTDGDKFIGACQDQNFSKSITAISLGHE